MSFIIAVGFCVVMIIAATAGCFLSRNDEKDNSINSSKNLHKDMNRERIAKGENTIPQINTFGGISTNNIAARDKSWNSVPDFFIKLLKGNSKK